LKAGHFAKVYNRRFPMTQAQELIPLTAHLVADGDRLSFLPSFFGPRLMMRGESLVFGWLDTLSEDYNGGFWHFYALTNGGFYMAPATDKRMRLEVNGNGFNGEMSSNAAGIVATLFALGQLAAEVQGCDSGDVLIDRYYFLRDFATTHAEAGLILAAID
jgi:hypothetical protein